MEMSYAGVFNPQKDASFGDLLIDTDYLVMSNWLDKSNLKPSNFYYEKFTPSEK